MEMSRQRLRAGVLEGSTTPCPHCPGTGIVRSIESVALDMLRSLGGRLITDGVVPLVATTAVEVALYILNQKRAHLKDIEARYRIPISVTGSDKLAGANFTIEKGAAPAQPQRRTERSAVNMEWGFEDEAEANEADGNEPPARAATSVEEVGEEDRGERGERGGSDEPRRRGRGRRRRGGGSGAGGRRDERREGPGGGGELRAGGEQPYDSDDAPERGVRAEASEKGAAEGEQPPRGEERSGQRSRRRGRRGGRRGRDRQPRNGGGNGRDGAREHDGETYARSGGDQPLESEVPVERSASQPEAHARAERPQERSPERPRPAPEAEPSRPTSRHVEPSEAATGEAAADKRTRHRGGSGEPRLERIVVGQAKNDDAGTGAAPAESSAPARKGWWQRRLGGE